MRTKSLMLTLETLLWSTIESEFFSKCTEKSPRHKKSLDIESAL